MATVAESTKSWVLTPCEVPRKEKKYDAIVKEFMDSGLDSVLISGPLAESVKPGTLVTSLSVAKRGMPISVHKVGDDVYLRRKK